MMRSSSTTKLSCGTKTQPWTLEAPAGQQIDVSLVEFSSKRRYPVEDTLLPNSCASRGQVIDKSARKTVSICRVGEQRNTDVYRSSANIVQVILDVDDKKDSRDESFLVRFVGEFNSNYM